MGILTFQAAAGGALNLNGPNIAGTVNLTLPSADGTSGQPLQTNGSGTLSFANLAIANGGTGATSFTANQIHYGSFSQSAGLTFDGTNFATTGTATAAKLIPTGTSVTGNGMYLPAANALGFSTAGTNAVYIDASQNVGIGTSSPVYTLDVGGLNANIRVAPSTVTNNALTRYVNTGGTGYVGLDNSIGGLTSAYALNLFHTGAYPIVFSTSGTERARIDSSGNVGIGVTPGYKLQVATPASGYGAVFRYTGGTNNPGLFFTTTESTAVSDINASGSTGTNVLSFSVSNGEKVRIDSSGNLLVGTTNASPSAGNGLKITSTGRVYSVITNADFDSYDLYNTTAGAYRFFVTAAGVINATTTTITAISDQQLKENIRDIDTGLNSIMALKPRRFDWKEGKGQDKKNAAGFIAQEFEEVFPDCVGVSKAGKDGIEYKNINYETLIPTFVKAIQEQQALITQLTDRIAALEAK